MSGLLPRLAFALGSYLLGSFPTGYLAVRLRSRRDIRTLGSGATGATNVLRVSGWKTALPVMAVDIVKGALPALLAVRLFGGPAWFPALAASLAVVGHCYPFAIGFRGGKGVATAAGAMAALAPLPAAASLAVFLAVVAATRYVSLGSLLAAASFPGWTLAFGPSGMAVGALPIVAVIVLRHAANIRRLASGTEAKLGASPKETP